MTVPPIHATDQVPMAGPNAIGIPASRGGSVADTGAERIGPGRPGGSRWRIGARGVVVRRR